ncbi:MAG TPA: ABC transporter permease [Actinokineospora sp.]|jgi:putative ABC transport system permease protein|nr:ABC transporter permease [Actinokineospora sp.]
MFVAVRDLRFAKGRFALMGAVIVLITLLVGLLSGLTAGLAQQNISAITGLPADRLAFSAPLADRPLSFSDSSVTDQQAAGWAATPGVTSANPVGIAPSRAVAGDHTVPVAAFGVPVGSELAPGEVTDRGVVLSAAAATALDAGPGDQVVLGGQPLVVAGVHGDASYSHLAVVWTSLPAWRLATGQTATVVALRVSSSIDTGAIDARLGTKTVSVSDSLSAIGSYVAENSSLTLMRGFLFAISALVVGAFFMVWTIQRGGDIAVLKALGASTGSLLRDALGQALALLTAGTALGTAVAAGIGVALSGSTVPFLLTPDTVLVPAATMIALGVLGAGLSVRRITSVDPLTALGSAR